jgi:hypothetical protein
MRAAVGTTELLESIAVCVLGGVLTAFVLLVVTASTPRYVYTGPLCQLTTVADPGFDPWTGEPHGRIFDCQPLDGSPVARVTSDAPTELIGCRAVPLPLGFGPGVFIALMWLRSSGGSPSRPWNHETG